jgi:hypothetical protein
LIAESDFVTNVRLHQTPRKLHYQRRASSLLDIVNIVNYFGGNVMKSFLCGSRFTMTITRQPKKQFPRRISDADWA